MNIGETINNIGETINNIYKKNGYLARYGGSLLLSIGIIIAFSSYFLYQYFLTHKGRIQKKWGEERCKPYVLPFAGVIMDPPNMDKTTFTILNFTNCTQNILQDIVAVTMMPFQFVMALSSSMMSIIVNAVNSLRSVLSLFRLNSSSSSQKVADKQQNMSTTFSQMGIKIKDIFNRAKSVVITGLFFIWNIFLTILSGLNTTITMVMVILAIMLAVLIVIWIGWYISLGVELGWSWLPPAFIIFKTLSDAILFLIAIPATVFFITLSLLMAVVAGMTGTLTSLIGFPYNV